MIFPVHTTLSAAMIAGNGREGKYLHYLIASAYVYILSDKYD